MVAAVSGAGTGLLSSKTLAPALSRKSVEGQEEKVRERILEGSTNMPAFKYGLKPAQIDMIIGYLKKVEDPDMTTTFLKRVLKR
jgi:hypothetical protein